MRPDTAKEKKCRDVATVGVSRLARCVGGPFGEGVPARHLLGELLAIDCALARAQPQAGVVHSAGQLRDK